MTPEMAFFYVQSDKGHPIDARLHLYFQKSDQGGQLREVGKVTVGKYRVEDSEASTVRGGHVDPYEPGFWGAWSHDIRPGGTIRCPGIEETGYSWWHDILGRRITQRTRGLGVRIGVIDAGFDPVKAGLEVVAVNVGGGLVQELPGRWIHGEAICRILGDTSAPQCCAPIAPCAELFFASATYDQTMLSDDRFRFPSADLSQGGQLDPTLVINAVYELSLTHGVDVINLSAGVSDIDDYLERGMTEAIETAADEGVLVVCAAGNACSEQADFPARLPDCVGVGVFGAQAWGPPGSATGSRTFHGASKEGFGEWAGQEVFHWADSAYGQGVDTIGPGVGILIARDGKPAFDLTGSSFAAPIVLGALAVVLAEDGDYLTLPRNRSRTTHARQRLVAYCVPTGMARPYEGAGAMLID